METVIVKVPLAQKNYELLNRAAEERAQTAAELLEHLAADFLETVQGEEANYRAVEEAQAQYRGEYIAVRAGQIVAHADKVTTLLETLRDKFNLTGADVLLAKIDFPDLQIRHPQLTTV